MRAEGALTLAIGRFFRRTRAYFGHGRPMSTDKALERPTLLTALALVLAVLVTLGVSSALAPHSGQSHPTVDVTPAAGGSQQWAFGGHAGAAFSCSGSVCGSGSTISSLSLHYYVEWVVIYTATNVSSTQTEFEVQSAINASLGLSLQGCINETGSGACSQITASGNLAGSEVASGFTNVTNTGRVYLSAGPGSPAEVAAMAVTNAQSSASFNFSGSFSETLPVNGTTQTGNFNFDLGGTESSGITFSTPLGVVPINPQPGQDWNSSAPFSATGTYTSGYSLNLNAMGHSQAENSWKTLSVAPSGTLDLTGADLAAVTLHDNYTSPPTSVSAQVISLSFGEGGFVGTHGWLLLPSGLYGGAIGVFSGISLIGNQPAATTAFSSGESADYQSGVGFVGENAATNASAFGTSAKGGPAFSLQAGPEPVSVASQQYSAITSASSGSAGLPWGLLIGAVVVVVVVVVAVVLLVRARSRRGPPGQPAVAPMDSMSGAGPVPPGAPPTGAPSEPTGAPPAPTGASPGFAAATPVCPTCGQPGSFVSEYNRYYCFTDRTYL
jgi:hypothetical protein